MALILPLAPSLSVHASETGRSPTPTLPAFPGAEGFGAKTPGGRGGRIIEVTNLNDHGLGSLREAIEAHGPRIVVFRVSGTITLESNLVIRHPQITIAGQTAPGEGICLRKYKFGIAAKDVIVRYLRVRRGDESLQPDDSLGIYDAENVIVDHCSLSWACDEVLNTWHGTKDATVQWCLVSEALHNSIVRKGHGFAATLGGVNTSYHHNLLASNAGRNPSIAGNRLYQTVNLDYRNNVLFNWEHRTIDGKPTSINVINNYYRPGPASIARSRIAKIDIPTDIPQGEWFIQGNYLEGAPEISRDNWNGGVVSPVSDLSLVRAEQPFEAGPVRTVSAQDVLEPVLQSVGATLPTRDSVDTRILNEARTGKTTCGDGIIRSQNDVGGWPELKSLPAPADDDHDGMPNEWEQRHELNPGDSADGAQDRDGDGYTNVEEYLNGTDPVVYIDYHDPRNNVNTLGQSL